MTIDEAIKHCEEVAKNEERFCVQDGYTSSMQTHGQCAAEHRQLAEWLRELQELREKVSGGVMRICELEKVNEHLREWNRKLTDLKNEFMCKYDESQEELQELREKHKEVIKLTGTTIETALENLDAKDMIRELATYLYDAIDGFQALGKELDDNCELNLECDKCPLRNGGNCKSWKHTKAVLKLIGGI